MDAGVALARSAAGLQVRVDPAQRAKPTVQKDPEIQVRPDLATPAKPSTK
jgi:hypothetical protein